MAAASTEFNYACQKCPRTFKLQEFYEKHVKVHALKKQHVCRLCGYVYGAAKGLEGHIETAHGGPETVEASNNLLLLQHQPPPPAKTPTKQQQLLTPRPELPFGLGFHFLQSAAGGQNGSGAALLAAAAADQAKLAQESASLLAKAQQAMLVAQMKSVASRSALSLSVASPSPPPISAGQQATAAPSPQQQQHLLAARDDKSKIPSPAGTGNYRIYGTYIKILKNIYIPVPV
jgi:hypothetical protein